MEKTAHQIKTIYGETIGIRITTNKKGKLETHREVQCKTCGTIFKPHKNKTTYCSKQCSNRSQLHFKLNKQGTQITSYHQLSKYKPPTNYKQRACQRCGKMFQPTTQDQYYCSSDCLNTEKAILRVNKRKKRVTGLVLQNYKKYEDKVCQWCGKPFTPHQSTQKYCNKTCSGYAEQENTMNRVRRFRKKYKDVLKQARRILGTGGLGQHACTDDWQEEYNKIRKERLQCGLPDRGIYQFSI